MRLCESVNLCQVCFNIHLRAPCQHRHTYCTLCTPVSLSPALCLSRSLSLLLHSFSPVFSLNSFLLSVYHSLSLSEDVVTKKQEEIVVLSVEVEPRPPLSLPHVATGNQATANQTSV